MRIRSSLSAAAFLLLAACATPTPYQPFSAGRGGYSEQQLGPSSFRVAFAGNEATDERRVGDYLLRRAAELTLARGADWFRVTDRVVLGNVRELKAGRAKVRIADKPGIGEWSNYGGFYTARGFGFLKPIWRRVSGRGGERLEASAVIELGRGTPPAGENIFTAREVLAKLGR